MSNAIETYFYRSEIGIDKGVARFVVAFQTAGRFDVKVSCSVGQELAEVCALCDRFDRYGVDAIHVPTAPNVRITMKPHESN